MIGCAVCSTHSVYESNLLWQLIFNCNSIATNNLKLFKWNKTKQNKTNVVISKQFSFCFKLFVTISYLLLLLQLLSLLPASQSVSQSSLKGLVIKFQLQNMIFCILSFDFFFPLSFSFSLSCYRDFFFGVKSYFITILQN